MAEARPDRTGARVSLLLLIAACSGPDGPHFFQGTPNDLPLRERCFGMLGPDAILADYSALDPVVPAHCLGTNHQDVGTVGKVVFLGDSITAGTPPTFPDEFYTARIVAGLEQRFGSIEVADCAEWGARIDDLLIDGDQIQTCFAAPSAVPTLVVFTIGGNDMVAWGEDLGAGDSEAEVQAKYDAAMVQLETTLTWLRDQQATLFPAGLSIIFTNVYEFTDSTNDVGVCPLSDFFDIPEDIEQFAQGYAGIGESYMGIAIRTGSDMVFLHEEFCGHGFFYDDPSNPCYRGPETEQWFDGTCIHPTPEGHARIAEMVLAVVDE
jgi:lysophospholipase L1-like esterase